MKTAVEQLIEEMQSYSYKVSNEDNLDMVAAFDYAIGIAKKYKEKEKLQIELAHTTGYNDCYKYQKGLTKLVTPRGATEYYNETYKQ